MTRVFSILLSAATVCCATDVTVTNGLVAWFDAAKQTELRRAAGLPALAGGQPVDRWINAANAALPAAQPVAERRPVLRAGASEAFLTFDGKDDFLAVSGPVRASAAATVFVVAAPRTNSGNFSALFSGAATGLNDYTSGLNLDLGPAPTAELSVVNLESAGAPGVHNFLAPGQNLAAKLPFAGFHVFTVRSRVGAKGDEVFLDGIRLGERARAQSQLGLDDMLVGARFYSHDSLQPPFAQGFFRGDIAAVLVYERALDDTERDQVEQALFARTPSLNALAAGASGHSLEVLSNPPLVQMLVPGFTVRELPLKISNMNNVRYRHDGKLVELGYDGRVHLLSDTDGDGLEDRDEVFWDKSPLRAPIGMALLPKGDPRGEGVFVSSKTKVSLLIDTNRDGKADEEIVVASGWKETFHGVDTIGLALDPADGSIYFALGCENFVDAYVRDPSGRSHYQLSSDRGTVQRVSSDFSKRETICTGVRFACGLGFNRHGDLFATDQEGATWLPNGNPLDELLHIVRGRHYGFPPRHPKHLPDVIDEPAIMEYSQQHQSTVGMAFNQGVNGGPIFGPPQWDDNALICGESRGKLYRTALVRTAEGYVARNQLIACLGMLTIDDCVTPGGDLLVSCHSGPPDWGTGPTGQGKLFKIHYAAPNIPQPVWAWAAGPGEFRIAFDRPLDPADCAGARDKVRIEAGRYVSPGDRYEVIRPGYQVVRDQMAAPRFSVAVQSLSLTADRRTLVIRVPRQTERLNYAVTLPVPAAWQAKEGISQRPEMDVAISLQGVQATLEADAVTSRIILPHPSLSVSKAFTAGSSEHEAFFARVEKSSRTARLTLRGTVDVGNMFVPATQPGSTLDWDIASDAFANRSMSVRQDFSANADAEVALMPAADKRMRQLDVTYAGPLNVRGSGMTFVLGNEIRPAPLARFVVPWAATSVDSSNAPAALARQDVKGRWLHGRRLFFGEAGCATCHMIRGEGVAFGPDLSNLIFRDRESVLHDILEPSATINPDHTGSTIKFKDGAEMAGLISSLTADKIVIRLPAAIETERPRSEVASIEPMKISLMPEHLGDLMSSTQMEDLLTFLLTNPLEPAPITRVDPAPPPPRRRSEVAGFLPATSAAPDNPSRLRILLSAGAKDHGLDEHDYPVWLERWSKLLGLADNVTVSTCVGFPSREQLGEADVTVFNSANTGWNTTAAVLLDQYQQRGGGLVYLHWSIEGHENAAELSERAGLAFSASAFRHGELNLLFGPAPHPITAGFDRLQLLDESYWNLKGDPSQLSILATSNEAGQPRPLLWAVERQKGRVFGCIPGHYTWTFDDPLYRVLVLRGIAWAARADINRLVELALPGARVAP